MPELPEVETMRRGLEPALGGTIVRVEFPEIPYRPIQVSPDRERWSSLLVGQRILAIDRIAKRVLVRISNELSIVMQPKMAGIALVADPPSQQHVRLVLHLSGAACDRILYWDRRGLGTVHLWDMHQCDAHLGPAQLGPDALTITLPVFIDRFRDLKRPIKPALLDQKRLAGVGNLYASEILFRARIAPERPCNELTRAQWKRMHAAMLEILGVAIENQGSTLKDGTYRNAVNGEGQYQSQHAVYDREDALCVRCRKQKIVRIVQAQRSTFYCPGCQSS